MNENNANELKPFNQLNQDEKIDRLVGEVKRLINLTDYLTERLNKQSNDIQKLNTHHHTDGKVVVSIIDNGMFSSGVMSSSGIVSGKLNRKTSLD